MGKPGNTTKLKKKIFCKFGIIPRQSRVLAGTDFFQVNKNVQLLKHHRISEQENFQINNPLVTNSFQWHIYGESFVLYPWNANLSRKAVKLLTENKNQKIIIDEDNLEKFAGQTKYQYGVIKEQDQIGVTTGLAYTEYGGDLLDIEALKFDGLVGISFEIPKIFAS